MMIRANPELYMGIEIFLVTYGCRWENLHHSVIRSILPPMIKLILTRPIISVFPSSMLTLHCTWWRWHCKSQNLKIDAKLATRVGVRHLSSASLQLARRQALLISAFGFDVHARTTTPRARRGALLATISASKLHAARRTRKISIS
jgi:hypothetical protein